MMIKLFDSWLGGSIPFPATKDTQSIPSLPDAVQQAAGPQKFVAQPNV
jgi:hypothetical protein